MLLENLGGKKIALQGGGALTPIFQTPPPSLVAVSEP